MHTAVYWFGFVGAWLLFAGPVFQSSVELRAEEEASERMKRAIEGLPPSEPVSAWWWLLPPVHLVLTSRRRGGQRDQLMASLSEEDLEVVNRYFSIARGWMFVAGGAFLIALKETWELVEHQEWPLGLYWGLVVVMTGAALSFTGGNDSRQRQRSRQRREFRHPR